MGEVTQKCIDMQVIVKTIKFLKNEKKEKVPYFRFIYTWVSISIQSPTKIFNYVEPVFLHIIVLLYRFFKED
jgi:hypothetical protein